jgi:hypothetical protein
MVMKKERWILAQAKHIQKASARQCWGKLHNSQGSFAFWKSNPDSGMNKPLI